MRCPQCGHTVPDTSKFCGECGAQLTLPQPAALSLALAQELLNSARYAAVIAGVPEAAEPPLRELRAEAQHRFDQSVAIMGDMYWDRYQDKPPTTRRVSSLSVFYREQTPAGLAIDDAFESHAYTTALLARARQMLHDPEQRSKARAVIYAAQVLPNQQQHVAEIESLLATLDAAPEPVASLSQPENGQAAPPAQPAIADEDGDAQEPIIAALHQSATSDPNSDEPEDVTLTSEQPAGNGLAPTSLLDAISDAAPATSPTTDLGIAQAEFASIEALERLIDERAELTQIEAQLAQTQSVVSAESSYQKRLQHAIAQVQVLRDDLPALDALLVRPLSDWLEHGDELALQSTSILERIEAAFDSDTPLAQGSRERQQRRLVEWQNSRDQIADLANLEGQKLVEQLNQLEQQLPGDFAQLAQARERRAAYQETLANAELQEEARRLQAQRQEQNRILRLKLDNLYQELDSDPQQLVELRNEAEQASQIGLLPEENPLDSESFAYYDLLFASRYRSLTRPNTKVEQGQTLVGAREYLQAYKLLLEAYAELEHSDDPDARVGAKRALDQAKVQLKEELEKNVEATLRDVDERLARFDYQAAQQNLQAQRGRIDAAEIGIAEGLDQRLRQAEAEVEVLSNRDRQARTRLEEAEAAAPMGGTEPDFPRALTLMDQAANVAPWLEIEIGHRRDQFRERREQFVAGRIQRANLVRQSGMDEGFLEAEQLLGQAEANAFTDEQRDEIGKLRGTIIQQQLNRQRLQEMLNTARRLADEAKQGNELELLSAQVAAERDRIGPRETPNVDTSTWAELNGYLSAAEKRIDSWRAFRDLVSQAEQAAFLGDKSAKDGIVKQLAAMSEHTYLPFQESISRVEQIARKGTKLERARRLIDEIREDLANNESKITADRIYQVLNNTRDLEKDPEIAEDRVFLNEILPLYQARDDLSAALSRGDFVGFDQGYSGLRDDTKHSPVISRLKQQADIARGRASFEQEYQALLRKVRPLFNNGWDDPVGFQEAVDTIRSFADRTPAALRSEQPRLHTDAIDQLDSVSSALANARADNDHFQYQSAQARVLAIINDLPLSAISAKNMLGSYASELSFLREIMVRVGERLHQKEIDGGVTEDAFKKAVIAYSESASDEQRAFRKTELMKVQGLFSIVDTPEYQARSAQYIATIKKITDQIDRVDAVEELMISGQSQGNDSQPPLGGLQRRKLVEAELNAILQCSKELRESPIGAVWRGIQDDPKYRALRANLELARALGDADSWLSRAKKPDQSYGQLRSLRGDAEDLKALNLLGSRDGEMKQAGLTRLIEACRERWQEVNVRLGKINAAAKAIEQRRSRIAFWSIGLFVLAALAIGAWQVPSLRARAIIAAVGTLTPVPTIAPTQGQVAGPPTIIVTATPRPTETPVPTATPVPPQPGVVIVPGSANVRARPNVALSPVDNVVAGNEVMVTGYAVAPDGNIWYRIDVPSLQRSGVWLLEKVPVRGQIYDTVRLDNHATLDPALQIPYEP